MLFVCKVYASPALMPSIKNVFESNEEDDTSIPAEVKLPILEEFYRHVYNPHWHYSCTELLLHLLLLPNLNIPGTSAIQWSPVALLNVMLTGMVWPALQVEQITIEC
jgi:hypothetical protein